MHLGNIVSNIKEMMHFLRPAFFILKKQGPVDYHRALP